MSTEKQIKANAALCPHMYQTLFCLIPSILQETEALENTEKGSGGEHS